MKCVFLSIMQLAHNFLHEWEVQHAQPQVEYVKFWITSNTLTNNVGLSMVNVFLKTKLAYCSGLEILCLRKASCRTLTVDRKSQAIEKRV